MNTVYRFIATALAVGILSGTGVAYAKATPVDPGTAAVEVVGAGLAGAVPGAAAGAGLGALAGAIVGCAAGVTVIIACPATAVPGILIGGAVGAGVGALATGLPAAVVEQASLPR